MRLVTGNTIIIVIIIFNIIIIIIIITIIIIIINLTENYKEDFAYRRLWIAARLTHKLASHINLPQVLSIPW